ncbi:unnamed protein product [Pieris brassicae]|uniref:EF-hand domain-containing protein n=2 Tax=Pieris TaxID=7115 RepID=A0A9P0X7S6_PIEBR|nr:unnamed protein product [Pieris brassicae]
MDRASGDSPPAPSSPPAQSGFGAFCSAISETFSPTRTKAARHQTFKRTVEVDYHGTEPSQPTALTSASKLDSSKNREWLPHPEVEESRTMIRRRRSHRWTIALRCQRLAKRCSKNEVLVVLGNLANTIIMSVKKDNDFYLRTAFGLLDRDSDGHVTPAELQYMLQKLGIEVSDDLIAELIKDASKTGNGLIDENDFMQWVTKIQAIQGMDVSSSGGDSEEEITKDLLAAFKVFDRDDNGYITRDELRTALEIIGEPVTDAQLNQVLALGDIDHDGRIDYEEFVKMLL